MHANPRGSGSRFGRLRAVQMPGSAIQACQIRALCHKHRAAADDACGWHSRSHLKPFRYRQQDEFFIEQTAPHGTDHLAPNGEACQRRLMRFHLKTMEGPPGYPDCPLCLSLV